MGTCVNVIWDIMGIIVKLILMNVTVILVAMMEHARWVEFNNY